MSAYEAVIGLEVHVQLATESKIFCACRARAPAGRSVADAETNAQACPVCAGHPGTLPVLNAKAVEYAVKAGLATGCEIRRRSVFARKNYFYPDLPKGYQISQYEAPVCEKGALEIETPGGTKKVRIRRIHLEEDAGKSVHSQGYSVVNLNRAGVPLAEIVSEPDLSTPEEAGAYLRALHAVVTFLGICDGNLQEGNFRCDANVSVRPLGARELGTRVEIKNVNSFRFVEKAIEHEIGRQSAVAQAGGKVLQETRTYDSDQNVTESMRTKEEAHDYRYFPDPDLPPLALDEAAIARWRAELPELPAQKKARYQSEWGLSAYDAGVLTASRELAGFFENTVLAIKTKPWDLMAAAKGASNLLTGEVVRLHEEAGIQIGASRLEPSHVADVVGFLLDKEVSSIGAKKILKRCLETGISPSADPERANFKQVSDTGALEPVIEQLLAAHPAQAAELKAGKEKLMGFFVGQAMKVTGGKANPSLLQEIIRKKLGT